MFENTNPEGVSEKTIPQTSEEETSMRSTDIEGEENKVNPTQEYTRSLNGVMVTEEEYQDYLERGRDAQ